MAELNAIDQRRLEQAAAAARLDSWMSASTGIGMAGIDKRASYSFRTEALSLDTLEEMFRGSDMAARICEAVPQEAFREGWELSIQQEAASDADERVKAKLDELNADAALEEAWVDARAYGGAGILLGVDDGNRKHPERPLDMERVRALDWLTVMTPRELIPSDYYDDPTEPNYGLPSFYRLAAVVNSSARNATGWGDGVRVHESRVLRLEGIRVPRRMLRANKGWGDSVLFRPYEVLRDFGTTWAGASLLLQDFAATVMKVKGLAELVASNNDAAVVKRAELIMISRSLANVTLLDSEEEFERKSTSLTGLPEMLQQFAIRLAAAAQIPVTILMGQAPAGLQATGASDLRWFYDRVRAAQQKVLRARLNKLVQLCFRALGIAEPANWSVRFRPLWQLTEAEQAELRNKQAQTDNLYVQMGAVTPEEIAVSRFGGDEYSTDTSIDTASRDELGLALPPGQEAEKPLPEGAESADPGQTLQGAQVASMLQIVQAVAAGQIPRESGVAMLLAAYPITPDQAETIMADAGGGFKPTPKPAPALGPGQPGQQAPPSQQPKP